MTERVQPRTAAGLSGLGPSPAVHPVAYRADVDGLRALAVLAVVIGHLWPQVLPGGYVGVDVFFVISGYLITQILAREIAQDRFSLAAFYGRRARRIFPALFAVLALTWLAGLFVLLPSDLASLLRAMLAAVFFGANVLFWHQSDNYFDATEAALNPLVHLWSLGVEEQFYLVFPWVLIAGFTLAARHGRDPRQLLRRVLWLLCLLNLVLAGLVNMRNTQAAFFLSPFRAWEFLAGALAALQPALRWRAAWMREAALLAALLVLLLCMALYSSHTAFPGWAAVPPVLAAAVLLHGAASGQGVGRLLSWPPLVGVGLISYSLYLWHWPVLVLAHHQQGGLPSPLWTPALLAVAVLLSVWSWRYVEQPWRRPAAERPRAGRAWALASVLGLTAVGVLGLHSQGHGGRVPAQALAWDRVRTAPVPWQACADRPPGQACRLGGQRGAPEVLLWGDSHMLAWAPAMDRLMSDARRGAVLAAHLGCAPLFELHNTRKRSCAPASQAVWDHLQAHPQIRTVVLAGYWSHYFRDRSPSAATDAAGRELKALEAARHGLHATVARLLASGREVVLIGPVPAYAFDVPQALALHAWQRRPMPVFTAAEQAERRRDFWEAAQPWRQEPRVRLVDPLAWFCRPDCALQDQGQALYRDAQHLSARGALWAEPHLARAMDGEPPPVQP